MNRVGSWSKTIDFGEGSATAPRFPTMPDWFSDDRDFAKIRRGCLPPLCLRRMSTASWGTTGYGFATSVLGRSGWARPPMKARVVARQSGWLTRLSEWAFRFMRNLSFNAVFVELRS